MNEDETVEIRLLYILYYKILKECVQYKRKMSL